MECVYKSTPLLGGLSSFIESFIGGFTVYHNTCMHQYDIHKSHTMSISCVYRTSKSPVPHSVYSSVHTGSLCVYTIY